MRIFYLILFFICSSSVAHEVNKIEARDILNKMNIPYDLNALCDAVEKDDVYIVKLFHLSGVDINTDCTGYLGTNLLYDAVDFGSKRVYRYLIDNGADINAYVISSGMSTLTRAISWRRYSWVYELLEMGAYAGAIEVANGYSDSTPLGYALLDCNPHLVAALIKNGASPNETYISQSALSRILEMDCPSVVEILIEKGANVNLHNDIIASPLMQAVISENYNIKIIKYLLERGANPNISQTSGTDALFFAVLTNRIDVVKLLIEYEANTEKLYKLTQNTMPFMVYNFANEMLVNGLLSKGLTITEISKYLGNQDMLDFINQHTKFY